MIGWGVSRLAGLGARLLGASKEEANGIRMFVAGITVPIDPIGGCLGMAHAASAQAAAEGSKTGQNLNQVMNLGSVFMAPGLDSIPDSLSSISDSQHSS